MNLHKGKCANVRGWKRWLLTAVLCITIEIRSFCRESKAGNGVSDGGGAVLRLSQRVQWMRGRNGVVGGWRSGWEWRIRITCLKNICLESKRVSWKFVAWPKCVSFQSVQCFKEPGGFRVVAKLTQSWQTVWSGCTCTSTKYLRTLPTWYRTADCATVSRARWHSRHEKKRRRTCS